METFPSGVNVEAAWALNDNAENTQLETNIAKRFMILPFCISKRVNCKTKFGFRRRPFDSSIPFEFNFVAGATSYAPKVM